MSEYIIESNDKNELSDNAHIVLSCFQNKNKEIINVEEKLSHDGYDSFGPESNLWDLFLIIKNKDDYLFYHYHREDWFQNTQEKEDEYELWEPETKLSLMTEENIHYFKKTTKDIQYNACFEERMKYILGQ